jgi:hypothetical protein
MTNVSSHLIRVFALWAVVGFNVYPASSFAAVAPTWSDISADKKCEGLLAFFKAALPKQVPGWTLKKPQCVISGVATGDSKWIFDVILVQNKKSLQLRYVVDEPRGKKPVVQWCQFKGDLSGCAHPWDNSFAVGDFYKTPAAAKSAYDQLVKEASGLLTFVTTIDAWVGKPGKRDLIFDTDYRTWIDEWVKTAQRLPTKDGDALVDFNPERENSKVGLVEFKGAIPQSLRECLGCGKTPCEKSQPSYEFNGIGLSLVRRLTPEELKTSDLKVAKASWVLIEPKAYSGNVPKWPFLCGEHRFNIQKI